MPEVRSVHIWGWSFSYSSSFNDPSGFQNRLKPWGLCRYQQTFAVAIHLDYWTFKLSITKQAKKIGHWNSTELQSKLAVNLKWFYTSLAKFGAGKTGNQLFKIQEGLFSSSRVLVDRIYLLKLQSGVPMIKNQLNFKRTLLKLTSGQFCETAFSLDLYLTCFMLCSAYLTGRSRKFK